MIKITIEIADDQYEDLKEYAKKRFDWLDESKATPLLASAIVSNWVEISRVEGHGIWI